MENKREDGLAGATPLRALLQREGCLTLPGVFDGISARMAASTGFDALYMTGYGVVCLRARRGRCRHRHLQRNAFDRVRCIAGATNLPFLADGDTGYGGLLNVDPHRARLCSRGRLRHPARRPGISQEVRPH